MILAPPEKFKFSFLLYVPTFEFRAQILHFYMYFCRIIILYQTQVFIHILIFNFIPTSRHQLFKKSPVNIKIKKSGLIVQHTKISKFSENGSTHKGKEQTISI